MSNVRDTHRAAMRCAEQAKLASRAGHDVEASNLIRQAFELEREAAQLLLQSFDVEPTRSVLYRSAATLALECGEFAEARRLAHQGLAGNPPQEIFGEIHEILEEEEFQRHLSTRGVTLHPEEFQMSFVGPAITAGFALGAAVMSRLENFRSLILRTGERVSGVAYRTRGRPQRSLEFFVGMPRAGSFALSVHIGEPEQMNLPGMAKAGVVVQELFDCFDLFESDNRRSLRERIGDDAYYANFVALARKIGPDGHSVRWVGLTSFRGTENRYVELKPMSRTPSVRVDRGDGEAADEITVEGVLRYADATKATETVWLLDVEGKKHKIRIPPGVDDVVRPYWLEEVVVTGFRDRQGYIVLDSIESPQYSSSK